MSPPPFAPHRRLASAAAMAIVALFLGITSSTATAAEWSLWRCGADGRSFSDRPCPSGQALAITTTAPSATALAEAHAVAARERAALHALAAQRHAREADGVTAPSGFRTTGSAAGHPARAAAPLPLERRRFRTRAPRGHH
ncbi:MAG: hypothetical protein ABI696_12680 [Rubrivivax sp.]